MARLILQMYRRYSVECVNNASYIEAVCAHTRVVKSLTLVALSPWSLSIKVQSSGTHLQRVRSGKIHAGLQKGSQHTQKNITIRPIHNTEFFTITCLTNALTMCPYIKNVYKWWCKSIRGSSACLCHLTLSILRLKRTLLLSLKLLIAMWRIKFAPISTGEFFFSSCY